VFNVEPQEQWDAQDAAEFERHVAVRHKKTLKEAAWAGAALLLGILCIGPFLYGHSLHRYWEMIGKYLLILAMGLLLWFVYKAGLVWASWQAARDTRREYGDPL
jgi:protein-S-isoprenylcysteine O-methyltransferase Ste14